PSQLEEAGPRSRTRAPVRPLPAAGQPASRLGITRPGVQGEPLGEITKRQLPGIGEEMGPTAVLIDVRVWSQFQSPRVIVYRFRVLAEFHPRQATGSEESGSLFSSFRQVMVERIVCLLVAPQREEGTTTNFMGRSLLCG